MDYFIVFRDVLNEKGKAKMYLSTFRSTRAVKNAGVLHLEIQKKYVKSFEKIAQAYNFHYNVFKTMSKVSKSSL